MLSDNLFDELLIQPVLQGANQLYIVSGYASSAMAFHHIEKLREMDFEIGVHLVVGMTIQDGLSLSNHRGFQQLMSQEFAGTFECSYIMKAPPVHSKIYAWFADDVPVAGYIGSANYSQKAFRQWQREIMAACNPEDGYDYFQQLIDDTIYCTHPEAEDFVQVFNDKYHERRKREAVQPEQAYPELSPSITGLEHVRVSFIDRFGNISERAGLNWGQRPEYNREPNQAYIPLKARVYRTDFFPVVGQHFTVYTDDGKVLICTRAQQNGKAIHTPHNNSLMGEYFRYRLGVSNGQLVTMNDFANYGRTHVDFYKIDEETYYMDFSVGVNG